MTLLKPESLAATLDALNDTFFSNRFISVCQRAQIGRWIAQQQGVPGAYAGMFAPTSEDRERGVRLFTGEPVRSNAGMGHVLSEEACRALLLLRARDRTVKIALHRAQEHLVERLNGRTSNGRPNGTYCCGRCSCALWRHLTAGPFDQREARLAQGVWRLRERRRGDGQWKGFPFPYTVLALLEIDTPAALDELRYAAPRCEQIARRPVNGDLYAQRRQIVAQRALALV